MSGWCRCFAMLRQQMENSNYLGKFYSLLVFFSPTSLWSSASMMKKYTPCWYSFHQQDFETFVNVSFNNQQPNLANYWQALPLTCNKYESPQKRLKQGAMHRGKRDPFSFSEKGFCPSYTYLMWQTTLF